MKRSPVGIVLALLIISPVLRAAQPRPADRPDLKRFWSDQQTQSATVGPAWVGVEFDTTTRERLAKAAPDETFTTMAGTTVDKVNQAYVWSSVVAPDGSIWFGTVANTHCLVMSLYIATALGGGPFPPIETNSYVCEFGPSGFADHRTPKIYRYSTVVGLTDRTSSLDGAALTLLAQTVGLRAAGTHRGVIFLGGPSLVGGMNLFAFDATSGDFIGAQNFADFSEVRRFAVLNDELYMGIEFKEGNEVFITGDAEDGSFQGGGVLRWAGSAAAAFSFEEVAEFLGEQVTELAVHDGRLAVGTWPVAAAGLAGVWMSPDPFTVGDGDGVLESTDEVEFTRIWGVEDCEPDPVTRATYGIGGMASFEGALFWGTMHVPMLAAAAHLNYYGDYYDAASSDALLELLLGSHRATSIFRFDRGAAQPIAMLYGMSELPVFVPDPDEPYWTTQPTGWSPVHGISGFGNLFNNYLWAMQVHQGRLWTGTMDWLYLLQDAGATLLDAILAESGVPLPELIDGLGLPEVVESYLRCLSWAHQASTPSGADLYYFPDRDRPAFPESLSGVDNYANYGVRTLLSSGPSLWVGTANPMNLMTDPADDRPEGGWELLRLDDLPYNTEAGPVVTAVDDTARVTFCGVDIAGYTRVVPLVVPCCGEIVPLPDGYLQPELLWLVGTSAQVTYCEDGLAQVCLPSTRDDSVLVQLIPSAEGPLQWLPLASGDAGEMMCGMLEFGAQDAAAALGYDGYLGIIGVLQTPRTPISPVAAGAFAVLLALAGAFALRRLG